MQRAAVLAAALIAVSACTTSGPAPAPARSPHRLLRTSARDSAPNATSAVPATSTHSSTSAASPTAAPSPVVPPVSAEARAVGLRDIRTIVPDAIVDLRYATPHNFVGVRLYPRTARCLVHTSMAHGLAVAARVLRRAGYLLVFWDCYRPHTVQVRMFRIVPNPDWVARPGPYATSHESGRSVDVTLAYRSTRTACPRSRRVHGHCLLAMGTGFDNFTPRAWAYARDGVSVAAQRDRALLRHAMAAGDLAVYSGEWWHFDGPGALVPRPILGAPLH